MHRHGLNCSIDYMYLEQWVYMYTVLRYTVESHTLIHAGDLKKVQLTDSYAIQASRNLERQSS